MLTLGFYIKSVRRKKDISQKDAAIQSGITPQFLNDLESDRRMPSDETLEKLAVLFNLDRDYSFYLAHKFPPDLRGTMNKGKVKSAYRVLRK